MPAERYDLVVEQGVPFSAVVQWCVDDADQTPIALGTRVPYMVIERDGVPLFSSDTEIQLVKEPGSVAGLVSISLSGSSTSKIMHPYEEANSLHYRLALLDPADAGNPVELLEGLVAVFAESL